MAFEVKYRLEFLDEYDRWCRCDVLQDGYTGETITEKAGQGFSPLSINLGNQGDEKYTTIKPTEIELMIFSDNFEFEEITEATDKEFQIRVYQAPTENGSLTLKHIGYVIPEIYSEPYVVEPYGVSIRAASLGVLKNTPYTNDYDEFYTGNATLMQIITNCLDKLDYGLDIWDSINQTENDVPYGDNSPLKYIELDQETFIEEKNGRERSKDCLTVLEDVLKPFVVNFFQDFGRWVIIPMELRATERFVRVFDSQGTLQQSAVYNGLDQNYTWLSQDQQLEFKPKAKEIESVYEHELPEDTVGNHDFNDGFTEQSSGTGTIRYPDEWDLSDISDFDAEIFQTSIRDVVAPNSSEGPKGVFMNSDYITDGGYIEYTGTKIIQSTDEDTLRFKIVYAGQSYERALSGDFNDGTLTIDHTFQIKIGSYYLTSEGKWTTIETDIVLTDLGDQISGYDLNPLDFGENRGASQFREFEIISEEIPESGFIRTRIYKPISENEGESYGDSYATSAYSMFSVQLYPEGLPPEDATNYFTEVDVETFADSIEYPIEHGDGPTNFNLASFLIDSSGYGDNIETNSWTRGSFSGSIHSIILNTILLEHENQSWLIQGTQKVRGLFDRWFHEYDRAYTPLSGSYDQRLCRFNGEMVQILNAEIDVWGNELLPGPNFSVEVEAAPPEIVTTDTIYFVAGGEYLVETTHNIENDGSTIESRNVKFTDFSGLDKDVNTVNSSYLATVLENGYVVVESIQIDSSNNSYTQIVLIDSDFNVVDFVEGSKTSDSDAEWTSNYYFTNRRVSSDGEHIYAAIYTGTGTNFRIHKYDLEMNEVWQSPVISSFTASNILVIAGQDHIVCTHGEQGEDSYIATSILKTDGSIVNTVTVADGNYWNWTNAGNSIAVLDGSKVCFNCGGVSTNSLGNAGRFFIYSEDLSTLHKTVIASLYSDGGDNTTPDDFGNMTGTLMPDQNGKIWFLNRFDNNLVKYDIDSDSIDQTYDVSNFDGAQSYGLIGTDGKFLIVDQGETDNPLLYDASQSSFLPDSGGLHTTWQESGEYEAGFSPHFHNWQLGFFDSIDPGTPSIENVILTATNQTQTVPFNSSIEFGADNTGDADITIPLLIDGEVRFELTIPAGGSESFTVVEGFQNPGSFEVSFASESLTITANGNTVTGDYEGWIDIESAATDDTEEEFPTAEIYVMNTPSQDSDCSGGTEFNVDWKTNEYCILISTSMTRSTLASAVAGSLDSQASYNGLDATNPGLSSSGHPIIRCTSQTAGTADNGETVTFGVPSALEQNGGIFSRYEITLSGGVDEYIVNEQIDILIGGSTFATTSAITALESADSIAQKIYDACVAVGSGTYTFAKNGTRVLVGSTSGEESLDLDIKNAGFTYSTQNIVEI